MACPKRYVDGVYIKDGGKHTPEYNSWASMKTRCDPNSYRVWQYEKYHAMEHEERLLNDFDYFYEVLGPRPEGATLDRIDNNRGYWADNIRWATKSEQQFNRGAHRSIYSDELGGMNLKQYCKAHGLSYYAVYQRINTLGWSLEEAIELKPRRK